MRLNSVVGAGQARNRVQQDDHVALMLDHALGFLDDHFGHLHVPLRRLVERGADHLRSAASPLHVGDFLGPLVNEQDEEVGLRIVLENGVGQLLHQHGLARARRSNDQAAAALADRAHQIEHPRRELVIDGLKDEPLVRKERREVIE